MNNYLRRIKDHFIPSEDNDFQPHFLRARFAAGLLAFIFVIEGFFLAHTLLIIPNSAQFAAIFASVLVDETNDSRITANLSRLSPNPILEKAAQLKADDMAVKGYFSHNSPDGKTPWYWFNQAGYDYAAAGENLAVNFTDSKDVAQAWLASPTHRANIMNANYTEIGIASARGVYKGKEAIFVVQEFGRPSLIARESGASSTTSDSLATLVIESETAAAKVTIPQKAAAPQTLVRDEKPLAAEATTSTSTFRAGTSTAVAGAASTKLSIAPSVAPVDAPILTSVHPSFIDELVASPRQASTAIYLILAAILVLALGLAVFIKIRVQYPHLITNGILLIAVLIALVLLNNALGWSQAIH